MVEINTLIIILIVDSVFYFFLGYIAGIFVSREKKFNQQIEDDIKKLNK